MFYQSKFQQTSTVSQPKADHLSTNFNLKKLTPQIKYLIGSILHIPLLPILAIQGKRLKKRFPRLPAAKEPIGKTVGSDKEKKVLIIGESTMAGLGVEYHKDGFAGSFAKHFTKISGDSITWKVVAKSGITAGRFRERYLEKLPEEKPDLILIGLGANEVFELNSPNRWKIDFANLLIDLSERYPETNMVLLNLPPVESFPGITGLMRFTFGHLMNLIHEVSLELENYFEYLTYAKRRIILSDWKARMPTVTDDGDFFSDGVHPNGITYKVWGMEIAELVKEKKLL